MWDAGVGLIDPRVRPRGVHVVAREFEVTLVVVGDRGDERLTLAERGGGGGGGGVGIRVGVLVRKVGRGALGEPRDGHLEEGVARAAPDGGATVLGELKGEGHVHLRQP